MGRWRVVLPTCGRNREAPPCHLPEGLPEGQGWLWRAATPPTGQVPSWPRRHDYVSAGVVGAGCDVDVHLFDTGDAPEVHVRYFDGPHTLDPLKMELVVVVSNGISQTSAMGELFRLVINSYDGNPAQQLQAINRQRSTDLKEHVHVDIPDTEGSFMLRLKHAGVKVCIEASRIIRRIPWGNHSGPGPSRVDEDDEEDAELRWVLPQHGKLPVGAVNTLGKTRILVLESVEKD